MGVQKLNLNNLCEAFGGDVKVSGSDREGEGSGGGPAGGPAKRESNRDKAERYREQGNERMKQGDYDGALDYYSRSINSFGGYGGASQNADNDALIVTALCNRSAAYAALRRYNEALRDADAAVGIKSSHAKAHSRRGFALFRLGKYEEAAAAYGAAIDVGDHPNPAEIEKCRKEALECLARATPVAAQKSVPTKASSHSQGRNGYEDGSRQKRFGSTQHVPEATPRQRREMAKRKHEADVQRIRAARKLAFAKWSESTGIEKGPHIDSENGGKCFSLDIFGHLRGRCTRCNFCQGGWNRDTSVVKHWSDTTMLTCSTCGCAHNDHEDCGAVQLVDPEFMGEDGKGAQAKIPGIHRA